MTNKVLEKPFLTNRDIAELMSCSDSKVSRIKRIVKAKLKEQGRELATNDIPTKLFIELMNLDVQSINGGASAKDGA